MEHIEIPVGELRFTARAAGPEDGPLVLLLHGFPQTSYEWRHVLPVLAEAGYRAVAPDQRGYSAGARPEGVAHYAVGHLVADVLAIADWLGGHTAFHLVAHDWGAIVAWQVAGRHPGRLRTLTSVSVPHPAAFYQAITGDDDQRERSQYMRFFQEEGAPEAAMLGDGAAGLRAVFASLEPDAADEYVRVLSEPGALTAALNYYRAMDRTLADIGPVTVPTLYVWSDEDVAVGRAGAEATAGHVSGPYRFEVLEGVSHWIPDEAAGALNPLLLAHLAEHGRRG